MTLPYGNTHNLLYVLSSIYEQPVNPKKVGLHVDVMQSHALCRMHFGQYQASSAGVTSRWELISHTLNAVRWLALSIPQAEAPQVSLCAAVYTHAQSVLSLNS